jgi:hypothetical protein
VSGEPAVVSSAAHRQAPPFDVFARFHLGFHATGVAEMILESFLSVSSEHLRVPVLQGTFRVAREGGSEMATRVGRKNRR